MGQFLSNPSLAMPDYYSLRVTKQPPEYVFPDDWFEIEVAVETQQDAPGSLEHLSLRASVHIHDGRLPMREACAADVAALVSKYIFSHPSLIDFTYSKNID